MTMIDVRPVEGLDIAVVNADDVFLKDEDTANQFFVTVKLQGGTNLIAINQEAFPTRFWDPTTGFPGRVLDRLIQNDVKMVVVGDFNAYANGPFLDFMPSVTTASTSSSSRPRTPPSSGSSTP